jgi:hypothetical protein
MSSSRYTFLSSCVRIVWEAAPCRQRLNALTAWQRGRVPARPRSLSSVSGDPSQSIARVVPTAPEVLQRCQPIESTPKVSVFGIGFVFQCIFFGRLRCGQVNDLHILSHAIDSVTLGIRRSVRMRRILGCDLLRNFLRR